MVHLISTRLDQKTSRAWEITVKKGETPTLKQLMDFLSQHCKALEASVRATRPGTPGFNQERSFHVKSTTTNVVTTGRKCAYCGKEDHAIYLCQDYLRLKIGDRIKEARARELCLNCLKTTTHQAKKCNAGAYRNCSKRHNTLLHIKQAAESNQEAETKSNSTAEQEKAVATLVSHAAFKQNK